MRKFQRCNSARSAKTAKIPKAEIGLRSAFGAKPGHLEKIARSALRECIEHTLIHPKNANHVRRANIKMRLPNQFASIVLRVNTPILMFRTSAQNARQDFTQTRKTQRTAHCVPKVRKRTWVPHLAANARLESMVVRVVSTSAKIATIKHIKTPGARKNVKNVLLARSPTTSVQLAHDQTMKLQQTANLTKFYLI
jgi:hypothetical protein